LQETRPNHGGAQETKELSWREFRTEQGGVEGIREVSGVGKSVRRARSLQLSDCMLTSALTAPDNELDIEYDSDNDPY
jgi:hypothetical protein